MANINSEKKRKNGGKIPAGYIFSIIFTLLAAANLVLLFVFDYKVPGFSYVITKIENYRDHVEGVNGTAAAADNTVVFEYEQDTYTYSGKGEFDPTVDVTVKSLDGTELSGDFLTFSVTGESSKEIVYNYKSEDGQYYGMQNRDLKLENYSAPVIVVSGAAPVLTDKNLGEVKDLCKGIYTATDGYGQDITDKVTISAVPDTQYNGTFLVQFSVTNRFGDTAKNEISTTTEFKEPHLKLSTTKISLMRGESFDPRAYIIYAIDFNGTNLIDFVDCEGEVDTHNIGKYTVKYDLTNPEGQAIKTKKLTVEVKE